MRGASLILLLSMHGACTTKAGGHQAGGTLAPSASVSSAASASKAPALAREAPQPDPFESFRAAMRALDWKRAAELFDSLPEEQRKLPEFRFARAYAAKELGQWNRVLEFTDELAEQLPLLKPEIARIRAQASRHTGHNEEAIAYFSKHSSAEDLLSAAQALKAEDKLDEARRFVDRALAKASTQRNALELMARIRAERVAIATKKKQTALMALDLRWLALSATTMDAARGAADELERIKGQKLTKRERYDRAMAFAADGRIAEVEAELSALERAPGPALPEAELLHARAWAHYSNREYEQAVSLFDQAIQKRTQHIVKDTFYAARALSRADKDSDAIERYRKFAKAYPGSSLSEDARYLIGRLYYILGNWSEAAKAYNHYLVSYSKGGRFRKTARYELAVTRLAQKDYEKALTGFQRLLKSETNPRLKTRYGLLEAIALVGADKKQEAIQKLRALIDTAPLTFAALAAQRRLELLGETPPPPMPATERTTQPEPLRVELPKKIRLLAKVGLDELAEKELEDQESQLRAKHAPRQYESLCQAYSTLSVASRRYRVGQQAARWTLLTKPPTAQTRWLWDCVYPHPYATAVNQAEREFHLPAHLVHAVMRQESGFRPRVVSPAKAVGLMQLIEPTARRVMTTLGQDYDPRLLEIPAHNIRFGAYYLRQVLDTFGQNIALGAAAYNAGPAAVSHWLESGEQLDLDVFVARIPYRETRGYVEHVIENLARYAYLAGDTQAVPSLDLKIQPGLRAGPDAY